jgi:hypothetical protein
VFGAAGLLRQRAGLLLGGGALRPSVLAGMSEWLAPPLALALAVSSASGAEAGLNWHQHGATLHLGNHCVHCVCLSFSVGRSARFRSSDRNRGCLLAFCDRSQAQACRQPEI